MSSTCSSVPVCRPIQRDTQIELKKGFLEVLSHDRRVKGTELIDRYSVPLPHYLQRLTAHA